MATKKLSEYKGPIGQITKVSSSTIVENLNAHLLGGSKRADFLCYKGDIDNTDLNTVWEPGFYLCTTQAAASYENHFPVISAGNMIVLPCASRNIQIYISHMNVAIYVRTSTSPSVAYRFSDWGKVAFDTSYNDPTPKT